MAGDEIFLFVLLFLQLLDLLYYSIQILPLYFSFLYLLKNLIYRSLRSHRIIINHFFSKV